MVESLDELRDSRHGIRRMVQRAVLAMASLAVVLTIGNRASADDAAPAVVTEFERTPRRLISLLDEPLTAATSPDGSLLVTGQNDGTVVAWNTQTGLPVKSFPGHSDTIGGVAFDASGSLLASAGYDATVRIWNVNSGESVAVLNGHAGRLTTVALSPDGTRLASGGYDRTVRLWDLRHSQSDPLLLEGHDKTVRCLAFSSDGQRLATGDDAGTMRVFNVSDGSLVKSVEAHRGRMQTVRFSPDGALLASGGDDASIVLWDAHTIELWTAGLEDDALSQHTAPITSLTFSPSGRLLVTGDRHGYVETRDLAEQEVTSMLKGHDDTVTGVAFLAGGEALLSVGLDRTVNVWRSKLPLTPRRDTIDETASRLWTLAVSPDGEMLYAGGRDSLLASWNLMTGEPQTQFTGFDGTIDALALSPNGGHIACCGWKHEFVMVFDTQTGEKSAELTMGSNVRCVQFSRDGQQIVAGCEDGTLRVWNVMTDGESQTVQNGPLAVYDVAFSPDGKQLIACSGDWRKPEPGSVTFWNTDGWSESQKLIEHEHAVRAVTFTRDGRRLATAGEDGQVILWHPETHVPLARLNNGTGVRPIAFSPDGTRLAVGLHDGTINVWDVERGEVVKRFQSEDDVFAVSYSRDGSTIYSVSGEKRIEVWPSGEP